MDSKKLLTVFVLLLHCSPSWGAPSQPWMKTIKRRLSVLDSTFPNQVGVYIKDLKSGEKLSFHADEPWYLASSIKVPVAIEVMRQVESGQISLNTLVPIQRSDYLDGGDHTNKNPSGSLLSVGYLLDQMLVWSDNTATDLLIRLVGLDSINQLIQENTRDGLPKITSLAEVRRQIYSGIHPKANQLKNSDFLALKSIPPDRLKVRRLAQILQVPAKSLQSNGLKKAYDRYYSMNLNSGRLTSYGELLEKLTQGRLLKPSSTHLLLEIMERVETGKKRIQAGFPKGFRFAHKTGTQFQRICDSGIAWNERDPSRKIVISACTRHFKSAAQAEKALQFVGRAIADSGILDPGLT